MYLHVKEGRGEDMEGKRKFEKQTGNRNICQGNKTLHREDGYFLSASKAQSELTALEKAPVANYILTAG